MCGICGIIGVSDKESINEMTNALSHRGPDEKRTMIFNGNSFGFSRLSIIDLDNGLQPMFNEEGNVLSIINGEIYNYNEIRENLEQNGHEFQSNCDSEVLPHLYEEYQENFTRYLNGMFAFAIWDNNKLILGRDRLGQKPLYYVQYKDIFVFSSEIKSLLKFKDIEFSFNFDFAYPHSYFEMNNNTFISQIKQVKPGHILIYEKNKQIVEKPFWKYAEYEKVSDEKDIIDRLKNSIEDSVKLRLKSDVPVGVLLSGGLDSNIILALAAKYKTNIKTFTVGSYNNSEIEFARQSAKLFNTDHHEILFDSNDMQSVLPSVVWGIESCEPRTVDTSIPTYFVMKLAKQHVKVLLCGEGSDEIFCGYQKFFMNLQTDDEIYNETIKHASSLYNLNLRRVDGISMANSLEARCPFLDYRVVDSAFKIKPKLKTKGIEKYILRKAFENDLTREISYRPKLNFNVGTGVTKEWQDWLKANLTDDVIGKFRIKDIKRAKTKIWQSMDEEVYYRYMILLSNLYYEMFLEENTIGSVKEFING